MQIVHFFNKDLIVSSRCSTTCQHASQLMCLKMYYRVNLQYENKQKYCHCSSARASLPCFTSSASLWLLKWLCRWEGGKWIKKTHNYATFVTWISHKETLWKTNIMSQICFPSKKNCKRKQAKKFYSPCITKYFNLFLLLWFSWLLENKDIQESKV